VIRRGYDDVAAGFDINPGPQLAVLSMKHGRTPEEQVRAATTGFGLCGIWWQTMPFYQLLPGLPAAVTGIDVHHQELRRPTRDADIGIRVSAPPTTNYIGIVRGIIFPVLYERSDRVFSRVGTRPCSATETDAVFDSPQGQQKKIKLLSVGKCCLAKFR
jgi:hypothetical protein